MWDKLLACLMPRGGIPNYLTEPPAAILSNRGIMPASKGSANLDLSELCVRMPAVSRRLQLRGSMSADEICPELESLAAYVDGARQRPSCRRASGPCQGSPNAKPGLVPNTMPNPAPLTRATQTSPLPKRHSQKSLPFSTFPYSIASIAPPRAATIQVRPTTQLLLPFGPWPTLQSC
jgi:hypothetical protein